MKPITDVVLFQVQMLIIDYFLFVFYFFILFYFYFHFVLYS